MHAALTTLGLMATLVAAPVCASADTGTTSTKSSKTSPEHNARNVIEMQRVLDQMKTSQTVKPDHPRPAPAPPSGSVPLREKGYFKQAREVDFKRSHGIPNN